MTDHEPTREEREEARQIVWTSMGDGKWLLIENIARALAARRPTSYENALADMEQHLHPEWARARDEVMDSGNSGWTMIAKRAIEMRCGDGPSAPTQPEEREEVRSYRKRPLVIEAIQWTGENYEALRAWGAPVTMFPASGGLIIGTLEDGPNCEAVHVADPLDWIIKGVKGEFYPCKPDIFAATYEPVRALAARRSLTGVTVCNEDQAGPYVCARYHVPTHAEIEAALRAVLFPLLASYECDEPHWDERAEESYTPDISLARLEADLQSAHSGDCTKEAHACVRCHAEHWSHKATWLGKALTRAVAALMEGRR